MEPAYECCDCVFGIFSRLSVWYNCTMIEAMSFEPPVTAVIVQLVMFDCGFACIRIRGPGVGVCDGCCAHSCVPADSGQRFCGAGVSSACVLAGGGGFKLNPGACTSIFVGKSSCSGSLVPAAMSLLALGMAGVACTSAASNSIRPAQPSTEADACLSLRGWCPASCALVLHIR